MRRGLESPGSRLLGWRGDDRDLLRSDLLVFGFVNAAMRGTKRRPRLPLFSSILEETWPNQFCPKTWVGWLHLQRMCKAIVGVSPKQFQERLRMEFEAVTPAM